MIRSYIINCASGYSRDWVNVPEITSEEAENLNEIGYSGKKKTGERTSLGDYLEEISKGKDYRFGLKQTKFDNGDFSEKYMLTVVKNNEQMFTYQQVVDLLGKYDREFKLNTVAYTKACTFTVEEWAEKNVK